MLPCWCMKIAVMGSGAVGGYFGGRLAQAGEEVIFVARGANLRALQENGLRVDSINGDFLIRDAHATDDPSKIGKVDYVIVGVKTWQVAEAAEAIRPLIGPNTCVLPLQNGVEAADQLASTLGAEHVLGGLCQLVAFVVEPGHIRHAAFDPLIAFGELDNRKSERVEKLRQAFERVAVRAQIPDDIHVAIWAKFLFIAPYSGVGSVTRAPIGPVRSLPETRDMLIKAMHEILALAHARGVALPEEAVTKSLANIDSLPAEATGSMQRDVLAGRPSELEAQNGAVVRLGHELGIATPVNEFIYNSLLPQEMQARSMASSG
jgi:2-dehydropantoate 2-reductase